MENKIKIKIYEEDVYKGELLLVNAKYSLKDDEKNNLIPADDRLPNILMQHSSARALKHILEEISAGDFIVLTSGYRSEAEQTDIYDNSMRDNGAEFTKKYVALPNHSEHQTGLAIDLGLNKADIDFICPDFPYDGICNDFRLKAPDYGFIQRYTKEKEGITGIAHEPWHFRYVGYPHSKIISDYGFALEEYIEFVRKFDSDCRLVYKDKDSVAEVYFVPLVDKTEIMISEFVEYQISGNNIDGIIVTEKKYANTQL